MIIKINGSLGLFLCGVVQLLERSGADSFSLSACPCIASVLSAFSKIEIQHIRMYANRKWSESVFSRRAGGQTQFGAAHCR